MRKKQAKRHNPDLVITNFQIMNPIKLVSIACFFAIFSGAITGQAIAQKVGVVYVDSVMRSMADYLQTLKDLSAYKLQLDSSITEMESQLQSQFQEYQQKSTTWPQLIKAQKEQQLQQAQEALQVFRQKAQEDLTQQEQSRLQPFYDRAKKAVEAVAKKKGMDHVAAIQTYLYSNPKMDITEDVINMLADSSPDRSK